MLSKLRSLPIIYLQQQRCSVNLNIAEGERAYAGHNAKSHLARAAMAML